MNPARPASGKTPERGDAIPVIPGNSYLRKQATEMNHQNDKDSVSPLADDATSGTVEWGKGHVQHSRIPAWVTTAEIGDRAYRLYGLLALLADSEGVERITKKRLMERLSCARSTLDLAIKELEAIGAVTVVFTHRADNSLGPNNYTLQWLPPGQTDSTDESEEGSGDGSGVSRTRVEGGRPSSLQDLPVRADALTYDLSKTPVPLMLGVAEVYDYWRLMRGKTRATYDRISPKRRDKIKSRLAEFTVHDLLRAIDGVCADPWRDRDQHDDITVIFRSREQVERFLEIEEKRPGGHDAIKLLGDEAKRLADAGL